MKLIDLSAFCFAGLVLMLQSCANTLGPTANNPEPKIALTAPIQVYSAGSLREALSEIAREHTQRTTQKIDLTFGASGLLRERIEKGESAQIFTSADTGHPLRLAQSGVWQAPSVFVRNQLCALTQPQLEVSPATLLDALLRPDVRVGTSTPKADPSGDYAWALFGRAEALRPGALATLDAKALQLTGGANSPQPPAGRSVYAWLMQQNQADLFLVYCTNAVAAQREMPMLKVVQVPPELQVGAAYGMTVRTDAPAAARLFAQSLLLPDAQRVFKKYGFGAP